ncbi:hypothetical protein K466DRAFT_507267 [Polyporus arcularius HHB13444]|uniref:DNA breaking-rejoining enzyme n=1 Tax=Polyporus arcularius HHB13444 TaxID=1314778 RepID=A0A5C3NL55_9APHY|nr:hypothetical protein K466DRAFT_507267 [Polyporus arcularius HHB13444]
MDISTGKHKDLSIPRVTYATAQKMRASISHKFGRGFKIGTQMWTEHPVHPGLYMGNPSLSVTVSEYMISLRRRKVQSGEIVTSARAIDHLTLKQLWEYNSRFPKEAESAPQKRKRGEHEDREWAGYKVRVMLGTAYTTSTLCLLRYDEVLRIQWKDIELMTIDGVPVVKLSLPFRKTHQNGECAPFYLWPNKERPWMDATLAIAEWWSLCTKMGIETNGYVFRSHRHGSDEVGALSHQKMSSSHFLECFRNNLLDIGIDPRTYGTHSFRRGGCQYLHTELRWPIRTICDWGGWAEDMDNHATIFRYLLSWVDSPTSQRVDLFNPNRVGTDPCTHCGRTCHCS